MYSSSLFAFFTAGLAAVASAYTTPVGDTPEGNPISKPGLNEIVPVGKPYDITWQPTTDGTVTLVLLRGPSTNVQPLYPIVEKIPNTGSYSWTPSADLEPDVTHYGIQLIVDSNGQYQYTTQFGISNPNYGSSSSSSVADASAYSTTPAPSAYSSTLIPSVYSSNTTSCNSTTLATPTSYGTSILTPSGSGYSHNSTIVKPTKHMTVPHSLKTTTKPTKGPVTKTTAVGYTSAEASKTSAPAASVTPTGAAGRVAVGMGAVLGAFVLAL